MRPLPLLAAIASLAFGSDAKRDPDRIGQRDVSGGVNLYSLEKERALGRQLAEEVERQAKISSDPLLSEYVNRLGQNLVRHSDARVPFTFKVIEAEELNAFALPGGYVFVNTGLIKMCDEESELAAALSHEIAHVAARHMTRQATRSQLARLGMIPISILLGGWAGAAARNGSGVAVPAALVAFSRHAETEADSLGIQYLYSAGYDPGGALSLFEKLDSARRTRPGAIARIFATHPPDQARLRQLQREIEETLPARDQYVVTTSTYTELRRRLFPAQPAIPRPAH